MSTLSTVSGFLQPARAPASQAVDSWWRRAGRTVWRAFEESGRARASTGLLELADRWADQQPELAKELRDAARRSLEG